MKTAQLRRNDRDFRIGDKLCLHEYDPELKILTGPEALLDITDIIQDCEGLDKNFCILSVKQKLGAISRFNTKTVGLKDIPIKTEPL